MNRLFVPKRRLALPGVTVSPRRCETCLISNGHSYGVGKLSVKRHDGIFKATAPNELWLTEISEHETQEAKLCGCVMLDMYSRRLSAGPSTGAVKPPRFWAAIAKGRAPTAMRITSSTSTTRRGVTAR